MNSVELIKKISYETELTQDQVREVFDLLSDFVQSEMEREDGEVRMPGIGVIYARLLEAGTFHPPTLDEPVTVPDRLRPAFRAYSKIDPRKE